MAVIVTSNLVTAAENTSSLSLKLARIGYQTFTRDFSPTASSTATGFFSAALTNGLTHEFWKPSGSPATLKWDFTTTEDIDYVAIGAHELGSTGTTIKVEWSTDDSTYTEIDEFIPADDKAIMLLFSEVSARYVRITLTYTTAPAIGVVYIGKALVMQRGLFAGHSPITLSRTTEQRPQKSVSGQWIGRSIVRRGFSGSAEWDNLTSTWYRDNFDPFVKVAQQFPFFFAWRPSERSEEVALCWSNSNISPSNSGTSDFMDVSLSLDAYGVDA